MISGKCTAICCDFVWSILTISFPGLCNDTDEYKFEDGKRSNQKSLIEEKKWSTKQYTES
jgi:hypothetical protein